MTYRICAFFQSFASLLSENKGHYGDSEEITVVLTPDLHKQSQWKTKHGTISHASCPDAVTLSFRFQGMDLVLQLTKTSFTPEELPITIGAGDHVEFWDHNKVSTVLFCGSSFHL